MRILPGIALIVSLALAGCGGWRDSRANPANWFGKSRSEPAPAQGEGAANPLIPEQTTLLSRRKKEPVYEGTLVDKVTGLEVEPSGGGAIVRVTGLTLRQGAHDVRLTSDTEGEPVDGNLTFRLRAVQPQDAPGGPESTRTVQVGRFVSGDVLARTRTIQIVGARNIRSTRR